ncbi:Ig-like domain-containing protein [Listeria riparia]|uniref:Modifier protein of major autolysin LytC n=1 Tax=Listeria riparia FSL S10-1204 TaxID=1265816 RepID=W7D7Z8_9LIST|nr:Ig-like domain-containing protein [Listeria riparia]EUJ45255.1 modifier protein of major autolysin LytC [Listeria riparia FSL S10-1204]
MKKKALLWAAGLAATTGGALGLTDNEIEVRAAENEIMSQSTNKSTGVNKFSSKAPFIESVDVTMSDDKSLQITEGFRLGSTSISGISTPDGEVTIKYGLDSGYIAKVPVDENGRWQAIIPELEVGHILMLEDYAISSANGGRPAFSIYELWPSKLTESNIDLTTTNTTTITGTGGYPGVEVEVTFAVKLGNQVRPMKSSAIVDQDGNFEMPIVNQAPGYSISVQQKWNGRIFGINGSTGAMNFYVKVVEGIGKPAVNAVSGKETKVTGTGKQGAKVRVQSSGQEIGTATVAQNGTFEVTVPAQKMRNELQVTQEEGKDVSESTTIIVGQEVPEVTSELKEGMNTISGTASPGADIAIWTGAVAPVANVKSDPLTGQWTANVPALIGGNTVQVRASLGLNQTKDSIRYGIELGKITELRAIISGERVKVTGNGSPGATLHVKAGGNLVGTTTINDAGKFELLIMRTVEGEKLAVSQTKNGMDSVVSETQVLKGLDAPSNIDIVTANSTKVSGKGKPGATVSVKVKGQEIGTGQVNNDGNFEVTIPSQVEGTKLSITQKEGEDESAP